MHNSVVTGRYFVGAGVALLALAWSFTLADWYLLHWIRGSENIALGFFWIDAFVSSHLLALGLVTAGVVASAASLRSVAGRTVANMAVVATGTVTALLVAWYMAHFVGLLGP